MHAFGVKLDYNNTFWQIDILLDQHLDKSIIVILNCIALHCIIVIKTFHWTFPPFRLWFFRLPHFPTVITKMHACFWSLIKLSYIIFLNVCMFVCYRFSRQPLNRLLWNLARCFEMVSERQLTIFVSIGCIFNELPRMRYALYWARISVWTATVTWQWFGFTFINALSSAYLTSNI